MSRRVLIVEDDRNKLQHLREATNSIIPNAEIFCAGSYNSGLRSVIEHRPELILLDMSMPTFDVSASEPGGTTRPFGGQEILRRLRASNFNCRVIIVTQFDRFGEGNSSKTLHQLRAELRREHRDHYVDTISYSSSKSKWRDVLQSLLIREGYAR